MKQTIGRFLLQPNKNFPVDCETLDALQTNIALLQVLGNLAPGTSPFCWAARRSRTARAAKRAMSF